MLNRRQLYIVGLAAAIVIISAAGILIMDNPPAVPTLENSMMVRLFFPTPDGKHLVGELRVVPNDVSPKRLLQLLIEGPLQGSHLVPSMPAGTEVLSVAVKDRIAYVDFSRELLSAHPGGTTGELMTVYSVVNTLTALPEIDGVRFLVEGQEIDTLAGHLELRYPLTFDSALLIPVPGLAVDVDEQESESAQETVSPNGKQVPADEKPNAPVAEQSLSNESAAADGDESRTDDAGSGTDEQQGTRSKTGKTE